MPYRQRVRQAWHRRTFQFRASITVGIVVFLAMMIANLGDILLGHNYSWWWMPVLISLVSGVGMFGFVWIVLSPGAFGLMPKDFYKRNPTTRKEQ